MHSVGIDLGTTNSALAVNTEVRLVRGEPVAGIMPSVVAFPPGGEMCVGDAARQRRVIDPVHTLFSFKRLMGARWHSAARQRFATHYPHTLIPGPEDAILLDTRAGRFTAAMLSHLVLSQLAERTDTAVRDHRAVVTVPSAFDPAARRDTRQAAEGAGFAEVHLIEEPVAIACAYLHRSNLRYAVVYDLGGGTFDCAVIDCSRYPFRVLGHAGDPYLGGDDLDHAIACRVAEDVLRRMGWDLTSDSTVMGALVAACERAKTCLSNQEAASLPLTEIDPAAPAAVGYTLTRATLTELARPFIHRTFQLADEVLARVSLKARDIQAVFMAGGSTHLPGLLEAVEQYFGRRPRRDLDPTHVVAMGASAVSARPHLWPLLDG